MHSLLMILSILSPVQGAVTFKDGAYSGVQIRVDENLPIDNCRKILENLEEVVTRSSSLLHNLTSGQTRIRDVTVVLPESWKKAACQPSRKIVTVEDNIEKADIHITENNSLLGDLPWTLQARGCGYQGERINIPRNFLIFNSSELSNKSRDIVKEWTKYRYGVFEESGFSHDPIYPGTYREGNMTRVNKGCEDLSGMFCGVGDHYNQYAPTKQNILCGGRSAWEIIAESEDLHEDGGVGVGDVGVDGADRQVYNLAQQDSAQLFATGDSVTDTTFRYVVLSMSRYVLVLDQTDNKDHWVNIKRALYRFIDLIPEGSVLSIITVGETASVALPPTVVTEGKREGLHGRIPRRGVEHLEACLECGVELAIKTLGDDGGNIVIVTAANTSQHAQPVNLDKHRLFTITYTRRDLPGSNSTNEGFTYAAYEADTQDNPSSSLTEVFIDVVNSVETNQVQKIFESEHDEHEFSGTFYVEENTRTEVTVTLSIDDEQKIESFEVKDPSGQRNIFSKFEDGLVIFRFPGKSESGIWTFSAKLYSDTALPVHKMIVDVTARSEGNGVTVTTMGAVTADKDHNPIILVNINQGGNPVVGASVTAQLSGPGGNIILALQDTGLGYPDLTHGDGVYSAYVPVFARYAGYHEIKIRAENSGNTLVYKQDTSKPSTKCCGSRMVSSIGEPTGKFYRFVTGPSFFINKTNFLQKDLTPPSRISDFRILSTNTTMLRINFTWTAPGGDLDAGQVEKYEIRCHPNPDQLSETNFGEKGILVHPTHPVITAAYQANQTAEAGIPWTNQMFYYAIVSFDGAGNRSPVSNLVSVLIAEQVTTTTPPPASLTHSLEQDLRLGSESWLLDKKQIYLIAGIGGGVLLVITIFVIIMLIKAKKEQHKKKKEVLDTYEAGFYPDIKISKAQPKISSDGVYDWLDALPQSDTGRIDTRSSNKCTANTANRQKIVTDGSTLDLCCDEGSSCSRPTTSTDDSISNEGYNQAYNEMANKDIEETGSNNKSQYGCHENTNINCIDSTKPPANKSLDLYLGNDNQLDSNLLVRDIYAQSFSRSAQYHSFKHQHKRAAAYNNPHRYGPCGDIDTNFQGYGPNKPGFEQKKKRHESVV